jgi:threonine synthase
MPPILFHSTNGQSPSVNLRDALLIGQAPDRGLYFPKTFPRFNAGEIAEFGQLPYHEVALRVLSSYCEGVIPRDSLAAMCRSAYDFEIPLEPVEGMKRVHCLRLDCGPTASFKDFAAQMMARLFGRFLQESRQQVTILTATSGDTGSAVAHAFHKISGVQVLVLFPFAEVSTHQRKLMTTLGDNVRTIAVDGKFDDCQAMAKRAFADPALKHIALSSANSINIGRLLPQSVYYFYAASRVANAGEPMVFSVPSGNFGDMMGAVVAGQMGLPMKKLVVPVNSNDAFPRFLETGRYQKIEPSRNALSNAMNVGHPSNLARLVAVYGGQMDETGKIHRAPDLTAMRRDLFSSSISDERTLEGLRHAWKQHRLLVEPHGAVAWQGYLDWLKTEKSGAESPAVILETAHPAKFPEEIEKNLGFKPDVPPQMLAAERLREDYDRMPASYEALREYLIARQPPG